MKQQNILTGILLCNFLVAFEGLKTLFVLGHRIPGLFQILVPYTLPALLWFVPAFMMYTMRHARFLASLMAIGIVGGFKVFAALSAPTNAEMPYGAYWLEADVLLILAALVSLPIAYSEAKSKKTNGA